MQVVEGGGGLRKGMQEGWNEMGWNGGSRIDDAQATCPIGAKEHLGEKIEDEDCLFNMEESIVDPRVTT